MGWSRWPLYCQVRFSLCWSGLRRFAPHLSILQFCVGDSSSHLDWFCLIWSFLSALLVSYVVSVLVCPGWGQALRGWSGILYFVWWAGLVVVWWVLSGCVCVCLQDSRRWRGLTCQAQSRIQAVVHLTLLRVSRGQAAAHCRDHFSCNACIVELTGSCLHAWEHACSHAP